MVGDMMERREFCIGLCGAITAAGAACRERVARLKVPENADECADLFRFFTDPAFGLEQARLGLGLTGEPRVLDDPRSRKVFTFEDQSELVESVDLHTTPDGLKLTAIYIDYRRPVEVSLRRLESYLGASEERIRKVPAPMESPRSGFTNLMAGQKEISRSSHTFYPANPIAPGHLKGDLLFRCDTVSSDTKRVISLRYQRSGP